ncbi:MAG: nitrous oxide reductase family maturation protein NosD [Proteobacteria bacterium]|nr:nitrous oxide reductase family maturation protein NosD [Pseudomonadota bacterium]
MFYSDLFAQSDLQLLIDQAPAGATLILDEQIYSGNLVIEKKITIDGQHKAIIDGGGKGSVIVVKADGVVLKNLEIRNSGTSHDQQDSGIRTLKVSHASFLNNHIHETLMGIDMQESHDNKIIGNDISSKSGVHLGLRGDAIRVWASHRNLFRQNKIHDSRDMVIWYSDDNLVEENEGWNNRYSLHFMYAGANTVRNNRYHHNAVGIFMMYGDGYTLIDNEISYSMGSTGMGIGMKEVSKVTIVNNKILYCAVGIYFDQSPFDPDYYNVLKGNLIGHNSQGLLFHSTLENNVFKGNAFVENLESVAVQANGDALANIFEGNHWHDYEGFDRDKNDIGDSPHEIRVYLDQLWNENKWIRFYFASPVVSLLKFLAKLAPLTEPRLLISDVKPILREDSEVLLSSENLHFDLPDYDEEDEEDDDEGVEGRHY